MSLVTLVSGGIDSTLMSILAKEEGIEQFPLFINYGQLCKDKELKTCFAIHEKYELPLPTVIDISGFGRIIPSGITNSKMHIYEDAFLPNRNLLFLVVASAFAYTRVANAVAIGLLWEKHHIFPDQTEEFVQKAQIAINHAIGYKIRVITPLMSFTKKDILTIAKEKGINGTYSCHSGKDIPCGYCISCVEKKGTFDGGGV